MIDIIKRIEPQWHKNRCATDIDICLVESILGLTLPSDYKTFLKWSNGGEGRLQKRYLSLWPLNDIPVLNKDYKLSTYLANVIGIGTDGGGDCFALDYRATHNCPVIVRVPLGDLAPESVVQVASSFQEWIESLAPTGHTAVAEPERTRADPEGSGK